MATANGDNAQLMKRMEIKDKYEGGQALRKNEFSAVVKGFKAQIEEALPAHLKKNADKYARQAMQLFSQNETLQRCSAVSIMTAIMTATALGLDLTPQLGQCYIIPYCNSRKAGQGEWVKTWEAQFQLGYRGTIALAQRSGAVSRIQADVVREKDVFRYSKGLSPTLEHEESPEEDRGAITHVYAVANFTNGGYAFEVWPCAKVVAHAKKFSQGYYKDEYKNNRKTGNKIENANSPWVKDFESMAKKTLIMAIWKYLPVSTEVMLAGASDSAIRTDIRDIRDEKDVISLPIQSFGENGAQEGDDGGAQPSAEAEAEPAHEPAPAFDDSQSRLLDVLGPGGLGLDAEEQAGYVAGHTGKQ
ncbi:MAG: recombinase RecT, partial [Synergistaceae bacterium]|nr:recombinase RecT [Synergistaceae bacterium]